MGPPRAPPKVLRISFGRLMPELLLNQSLAVKIVLRWYSNNDPRNWLVPLLVTRLICAPEDRPPAAFELTVLTRNSSTASEFRRSTGLPMELVCWSLMLM